MCDRKITNVLPNHKVRILFFVCGIKVSNGSFSREIATWPQHVLTLNCPSLRSGQFTGKKCLADVETFLDNEPLDTYPAQDK